ncbi:MAG: HIT domain-containing protein [Nitrospirae bacterium]|nr:HIT domain-containing protein [Nitrospirota bacterium]
MDNIWAPWRIEYILGKKPEGCLFCNKAQEKEDEQNFILLRNPFNYIIMNIYPYNPGHLMIVPYLHTPTLENLPDEVSLDFMKTTQKALSVLRESLKPNGFNLGLNLTKSGGAGIEEHVHLHIVPRWTGDTSFITVLSDVRVLPEHLNATYNKLLPYFK